MLHIKRDLYLWNITLLLWLIIRIQGFSTCSILYLKIEQSTFWLVITCILLWRILQNVFVLCYYFTCLTIKYHFYWYIFKIVDKKVVQPPFKYTKWNNIPKRNSKFSWEIMVLGQKIKIQQWHKKIANIKILVRAGNRNQDPRHCSPIRYL